MWEFEVLGRYDCSDFLIIYVIREDFFYEGKDGLILEWLLMKYIIIGEKNNYKVIIYFW